MNQSRKCECDTNSWRRKDTLIRVGLRRRDKIITKILEALNLQISGNHREIH